MEFVDYSRERKCGIYLRDGDFNYRVEPNWAKLPAPAFGSDILCNVCDEEDNVYVATNCPEYPICKFDPEGNLLCSFGQGEFERPHSFFFTPRGTVLVADSGFNLHVIKELTRDGKVVRTFGTPHVPSDSGYDVDVYQKALAQGAVTEEDKKDPCLRLHMQLRSITKKAGPFNRPCFMVVSKSGEMFAADGYGNSAIHRFAPDGTYLESWGEGTGGGVNQFFLPHSLTVDKYDRLWLADRENSRLCIYNTKGEVLYTLRGMLKPSCSFATDKYVYIGELDGGITVIDIDSFKQLARFGYRELSLLRVHSICLNSKGDVFISTIFENRPVGNMFRLVRE